MSTLTRTYSSPNLKDQNYNWETQEYRYGDEEDEFYVIGDRVYVDGYRAGVVAYFGEVNFASGDYVGVVLDHQTGDHNGKVHGREYFQCAPFHGLFVRPYRVSRIPDSMFSSSSTSSRLSTPMPSLRTCEQQMRGKSPGCSTVDSYFYDDDYRAPSIASLEQKLRSIQQGKSSNHSTITSKVPKASTKGGILKYSNSHPRPDSRSSLLSARIEEIPRPTSASPSRSAVTFNFRPKRTPLDRADSFANEDQYTISSPTRNSSRIGFLSECRKGDSVVVSNERGTRELTGILRYLGETYFATGEWAGVELDLPEGKNDGSVLGCRYFYCPKNHGLFVPAARIRKATRQLSEDFKTIRSTIKSPPPLTSGCGRKIKQCIDIESPTTSEATSSERTPSSNWSSLSPVNHLNKSETFKLDHDESTFPSPLKSNNSLMMNSKLPLNHGEKLPLFSDADLDLQIKKSLQKPAIQSSKVTLANIVPVKSKSVKYTFSSSKYDGNPIVRRTVEYE